TLPVFLAYRPGHSNDALEIRELEDGDTVLVSLTGDAVVAYLQFLLQSPHENERNTVLTVPMKVRHVDKDTVLVEHTANFEGGPDHFRVELNCTLLRDEIRHENAAASKPRTVVVGDSDPSAKPQS